MPKLMIKKNEKTWEVPLLEQKLDRVAVCVKKDEKTYYAPTFKDDDVRTNGLNPIPLKVLSEGNGYRLYTISEITGLLQDLELYKWYINKAGRDVRLMFNVKYQTGSKNMDEFVYYIFKKETILRFNIIKLGTMYSGQIEYLNPNNNIVTIYSLLPQDAQNKYRGLVPKNPISDISVAAFA